jgi:RNA-splicing ligase RtcB
VWCPLVQKEKDVEGIKDEMASALFASIPVGVGSQSSFPTNLAELEKVLKNGIDWSIAKVSRT